MSPSLAQRLLRRLPKRTQAAIRQRPRARPTRDGIWFTIVLLGVVVAAVNTGNNLLYMATACLCAVLICSNMLAEWNLRGLRVRRVLPAEAFAGHPTGGAWMVENRRRWGAAWTVRVLEEDPGVSGEGLAWRVPAGGSVRVPARWTFAQRGACGLTQVRVQSAFPFGLIRRWRLLDLPTEVWVYPTPATGRALHTTAGTGSERAQPRLRGRSEDLRGLRPYAPGDRLRDLHWPTSARTGSPMVVERSSQRSTQALVEVPDARGERWERHLQQATGQVLSHFARGHAVGLRLGDAHFETRSGEQWRRHLLHQLAAAPERSA